MSKYFRDDKPYLHKDFVITAYKSLFCNDRIDDFLQKKNVFFILSSGRCGTVFLADLLNQADGATVLHEPVGLDIMALKGAYDSPAKALRYVRLYRKKKIFELVKRFSINTYGETTPTLIYHAQALQQCFPNCKIIHLVRDGRDVVRSWVNRDVYLKENDWSYRSLKPHATDKYYKEWPNMDQFEKCCWFWAEHNLWLLKVTTRIVRFEEVITDYIQFRRGIEEPLRLEIGEERWRAAVNKPKNASAQSLMPHWSAWSVLQTRSFDKICEPVMKALGYY